MDGPSALSPVGLKSWVIFEKKGTFLKFHVGCLPWLIYAVSKGLSPAEGFSQNCMGLGLKRSFPYFSELNTKIIRKYAHKFLAKRDATI
jgi:hypothetical protein